MNVGLYYYTFILMIKSFSIGKNAFIKKMKDISNFVYYNKTANIFMIQNMTTSLAPDRLVREREEE
jgi:hypothetical protein